MTIKNPHIIHMIEFNTKIKNYEFAELKTITTRYLCNQACGTTPQKSTEDWNEVTCKNCLKRKNDKNK